MQRIIQILQHIHDNKLGGFELRLFSPPFASQILYSFLDKKLRQTGIKARLPLCSLGALIPFRYDSL